MSGGFCDTLFNKKVLKCKMRGIKSKNHNLISCESNKTSTSFFNEKRYILNDRINTLPYGHKDISNKKLFFVAVVVVFLNI